MCPICSVPATVVIFLVIVILTIVVVFSHFEVSASGRMIRVGMSTYIKSGFTSPSRSSQYPCYVSSVYDGCV